MIDEPKPAPVDADRKILELLDERTAPDGELCVNFGMLATWSGLDRQSVRAACRRLRAARHAEFYRGLWTDEGEPAGSGYCVTSAGRAALATASPAKSPADGFAPWLNYPSGKRIRD